MILEGVHVAQHSLVHEKRRAPFHGFLNGRAGGMNHFSNVLQDRFGKVGGPCNVGIDPRVFRSHNVGFELSLVHWAALPLVIEAGRDEKDEEHGPAKNRAEQMDADPRSTAPSGAKSL